MKCFHRIIKPRVDKEEIQIRKIKKNNGDQNDIRLRKESMVKQEQRNIIICDSHKKEKNLFLFAFYVKKCPITWNAFIMTFFEAFQ